ncbi:MAG: PhoH family protein [Planctomycetota bacterium]|jgi:phosphate starvation-inducible PhoH-like protein
MREVIPLSSSDEERALLGRKDHTVRRLRKALGVTVIARHGEVAVEGDPQAAREAVRILKRILDEYHESGELSETEIDRLIDSSPTTDLEGLRIVRGLDGGWIEPKTEGQVRYVRAMQQKGIVLAIGPAGTGKTYLAVAMAISYMRRGLFRKLVLVRPAVEAGEKLGFLPGDLQEKVNPYLRPLYDALGDILEFTEIRRFQDRDVIEIVPLAFMRGRTLDNAFIILDEGQNTSPDQMMMFLTRMGRNSMIVATGDVTQVDLPDGSVSGLVDAQQVLRGIEGVKFAYLFKEDIVRHALVQEIVDAYENRSRPREEE